MKKIILLLSCTFLVVMVYSQNKKPVQDYVERALASGAQFKNAALLQEDNEVTPLKRSLATVVTRHTLFSFNNTTASSIVRDRPEFLTLPVPDSKNGLLELQLYRADILTPDFKATSGDQPGKTLAANQAVYYHGIVKGATQSLVAITITKEEAGGFISIGNKGNFVLGRLGGDNAANEHILYNENDMTAARGMDCGTKDDHPNLPASVLFNNSTALVNNPMNCTRIYVECDYQVVISQGSVAAANNYCINLFNQGAALYANEGIRVLLSQVFILASNQNTIYTSNSSGNLTTFQNLRAATFNGDLAIVVTTKGASPGTIANGIAAGFAGLCNSTRANSMASMAAAAAVSNVPTYSRTAKVFTHELGHLFGTRHTHACVWNGNNTAIDGCPGFTEGGCPVPPIPAFATIMSYGDTYGTAPIDFTLGFGIQPGNVIRNSAHNAACLNNCTPFIDLYIQDKPSDNGTEPNPDPTGEFWVSQDIWVRNNNDGGTVHQNPRGGFTNYVYVRVRNRGTAASRSMSNIRLRAYWAKASASLAWPSPWNGGVTSCSPPASMGSTIGTPQQIPVINAGGSTVMVFAWSAPQPASYSCFGGDRFHFCLLARIETTNYAPFGMSFAETGGLWDNVKKNNNIAWKNVSVSNPNGGFNRAAAEETIDLFGIDGDQLKKDGIDAFNLDFTFEKRRAVPKDIRLKPGKFEIGQLDPEPVEEPGNGGNVDRTGIAAAAIPAEPEPVAANPNIFDDPAEIPYQAINVNLNIWDLAFVDVDLGKLYENWSKTGKDFKILEEKAPSGYPWIRLENAKSTLQKIGAGFSGTLAIGVRITQHKAAPEEEQDFDFDITLADYAKLTQIGGETFFVTLGTNGPARNASATARGAGAEAPAAEASITLNAASKQITIVTNQSDRFEAQLFDQAGKLVRRASFAGNTRIAADGLPKGVYIVSLVNQRTQEVTKRKLFLE